MYLVTRIQMLVSNENHENGVIGFLRTVCINVTCYVKYKFPISKNASLDGNIFILICISFDDTFFKVVCIPCHLFRSMTWRI